MATSTACNWPLGHTSWGAHTSSAAQKGQSALSLPTPAPWEFTVLVVAQWATGILRPFACRQAILSASLQGTCAADTKGSESWRDFHALLRVICGGIRRHVLHGR